MEVFRKLAVKITGLGQAKGSGCIYELDNQKGIKYVLTAQHCLTNELTKRNFTREEMDFIKIVDQENNELNIDSINIPVDCDLDFAIVEIKTSKNYQNVNILSPERNMTCTYFGFPKYLQNDQNSGEPMTGNILELIDTGYMTIQNEHGHLDDGENDAKDNTVGFSGSGVYHINTTGSYLIGILVRLRGAKGVHGRLQAINISIINEFLKGQNLCELVPFELSKFDMYLDEILDEQHDKVKMIIKKNFRDKIVDINPVFISEKLREKLFMPYEFNGNLLNVKLWEGWLRLIIYICLYKNTKIEASNINEHIFLEEHSTSNKRFYYSEAKRMATFVSDLYAGAYKEIKDNDLIFVNSENIKGPKAPSQDVIHSIVLQIDDVMYEHGIDISIDKEYKKIRVVHIDYILEELETELIKFMACERSTREIEQKFVACLNKLFEECEYIIEGEATKVEVDK
ncbi:trypsin-like serine protease [Priestia aryabhattai]|uniref:ABC-three component system protein n=1 Tax=Priestia aryabhattai TaxID=412384 RepID=UPI002E1A970F|nr:trypsin-like serine protease [Priestia aryabhattai]